MADAAQETRTVRVWDVPTRLFHWALVILVSLSFLTAEADWPKVNVNGRAIEPITLHMWCGYVILALVLFRIGWGVIGSSTARFRNFVRGPKAVVTYLGGLFKKPAPFVAGHNPAGALMIVAMLAALLVQTVTGLYTKDDDDFLGIAEGPLYGSVKESTSLFLTNIHLYGQEVILILIYAHILANLFYWLIKREDLIGAMFTGRRRLPNGETVAPIALASTTLAFGLLVVAAVGVWAFIALSRG
jgi:cytochrome b